MNCWGRESVEIFYCPNTVSYYTQIEITMRSPDNDSYQDTDSEERYRRLFETAQDGILILNANTGKIIDANPFISNLTGYSNKELFNKYIWDLGFIKNVPANKGKFLELQKTGSVRYENLPIETKSGATHQVEFISNSYTVGNAKVIQCNIRDISSRVKLEQLNNQLGLMYQVILRCNQILIHDTEVKVLIDDMTKTLVSSGGFRSSWMAYAPKSAADLIEPISAYGIDNNYFDVLNSSIEKNADKGFVATAIHLKKMTICQDLQNEEHDTIEREYAIRHRYSSVAVIPIKSQKNTPYILVVYGHHPQDLTEDIVTLLENLTTDIIFGIDNLEAHAEHLELIKQVEHSLDNTIIAIASLVEQRDPYTAGHQRRVANLAVAIATDMGLTPGQITGLRMASVVHDIGKIHIPAEILSNPGFLTDAEYVIVKTHAKAGWEVLKNIEFPWPVAEIVYQHHERLDGSGYPRALKGDEILLEARILMVADVIDAMATHRPYRPALGILSALQEIIQQKGTLFDERAVDACVKLFIEKKYEIK